MSGVLFECQGIVLKSQTEAFAIQDRFNVSIIHLVLIVPCVTETGSAIFGQEILSLNLINK